MFDVVMT